MKSKTKQPLVKRLTACFLLLLTVLTLFGCAGSGKWMNARATDTDPQMDFSSCRLVLSTEDAGVIRDGDTLLGSYGSIHLLSFETAEETEAAYDYYKDKVDAVEPDATVIGAEGETDVPEPIPMTEETNPMALLDEMEASTEVQESHGVIALIDTGVAEQDGVIGRVSVLDEALEGGTHGQQMLDAIKSQDANAQVLSIRAMNDEGLGTISSLVSAMEYAIEQKVDSINLSVYAKMTLSTSVLKQEIVKATDNGILVVGAAGNDGADVAGYMPGSVEEAYIIGAAKEDGTRLETSNHGKTVDYNVVAGSTFQAAALFTGYVSANGLDAVEGVVNQGLIYATDYQVVTEEVPDSADGEFAGLDLTGYSLSEEDTDGVQNLTVKVIGEGSVGYTDYTNELVTVTDELTKIVPELTYVRLSFDKPAYVFVVDDKTKILEPYSEQKAESFRDISITVGIDKTVLVFFDKAEALKLLNEQFQIAADLPSNVTVGTQYTGECTVTSVNQSHAGGTVHGVTFGSFTGVLAGKSISGNCADHTAAAPFVGQASYYTLTVRSISGNTVTAYLYVTPKEGATDGVTGNDQGLIGYQRMDATVTLTRTPPIEYTNISVKKSWSDYDNESGARPGSVQIGLYRSTSSNVSTSGSAYKTATLNASNNWSYTWTNLLHKDGDTTYYYAVKEMSVPTYYTVSYSQPASVKGNTSATVTNKIQEAYFKLHKDSSLPDVTDDNNMYTLKGGQYTVFQSYADAQNLRNGFRTLTLDANGDTASLRLLPKTYYVRETLAPPGFDIDPTIYTINLTTGNTPNVPYRLNVEDPPFFDPTGIEMTKIWNGPETATIPPLTGTQFTVKYFDQTGMTKEQAQTATPKKTWVLEIQYDKDINKYYADFFDEYLVDELSDDFYRNEAGDPILPLGTYTIQETKTAPGYTFDGYLKDEKGQVIATDSEIYLTEVQHVGDWTQLLGGNVYSGENTPKFGSITLKKVDSDGKSPLEGVTFRCVGETVHDVYTATTDENGEVVFDNLYPDVYTITEIDTVDGHELLPEPLVVEVPMRVTAEYIEQFDVDEDSVIFDPNGGEDGRDGDGIYYINSFTYEISNHISLEAPMTGGITGWKVFVPMAAGLGILGGLGLYLGRRRKQS